MHECEAIFVRGGEQWREACTDGFSLLVFRAAPKYLLLQHLDNYGSL